MPKSGPPLVVKKVLKNGILVANKRLQTMTKMLQAIENRIYHNEAMALKAKSLMNAVGILLQEIPSLLEKADEESDGFHYLLFELGKQMFNFASLIEGQVRKKS